MKPITILARSAVIALLFATSTLVVSANTPSSSITTSPDSIKSVRFEAWEKLLLETYELEVFDLDPMISVEIFDSNLEPVLTKNVRESELIFNSQLRQKISNADLLMEFGNTKFYILKH